MRHFHILHLQQAKRRNVRHLPHHFDEEGDVKALKDIGFAVAFQPTGIVFAQLIVNLPFSIRMVRTAFGDVNPRMEFVAKT